MNLRPTVTLVPDQYSEVEWIVAWGLVASMERGFPPSLLEQHLDLVCGSFERAFRVVEAVKRARREQAALEVLGHRHSVGPHSVSTPPAPERTRSSRGHRAPAPQLGARWTARIGTWRVELTKEGAHG